MKNNFKNHGGFTLVEMLIAISLFVIVTTISLGAILSIFDANRKAQSSKTAVDNLNLSLENMVRTIRFGTNYHCDSGSGTLTTPANCPLGGTRLAVSFQGNEVVYRWDGNGPIQISNDGGITYTNITSSDTTIEYLRFYVFGTDNSNNKQPYAVAVIEGRVGSKATSQTVFSIETLISQRTLDI